MTKDRVRPGHPPCTIGKANSPLTPRNRTRHCVTEHKSLCATEHVHQHNRVLPSASCEHASTLSAHTPLACSHDSYQASPIPRALALKLRIELAPSLFSSSLCRKYPTRRQPEHRMPKISTVNTSRLTLGTPAPRASPMTAASAYLHLGKQRTMHGFTPPRELCQSLHLLHRQGKGPIKRYPLSEAEDRDNRANHSISTRVSLPRSSDNPGQIGPSPLQRPTTDNMQQQASGQDMFGFKSTYPPRDILHDKQQDNPTHRTTDRAAGASLGMSRYAHAWPTGAPEASCRGLRKQDSTRIAKTKLFKSRSGDPKLKKRSQIPQATKITADSEPQSHGARRRFFLELEFLITRRRPPSNNCPSGEADFRQTTQLHQQRSQLAADQEITTPATKSAFRRTNTPPTQGQGRLPVKQHHPISDAGLRRISTIGTTSPMHTQRAPSIARLMESHACLCQ
ncbi:hypothetical protein CRG98_037163 [Punica granatum]|uniref:Uncharacterized protein n=1 Tax=Punica granatum TaxID=22663 RepID=A0A2I0IEL9_PUNGR|nr:hypothetical protein CRG98_037163 [Punica granatum]